MALGMSLLLIALQKADAGAHIYLTIKNELIRIYAPKPCDSYRKALTRTMTGLPSQLGAQIVNDVCKKPTKLDGCCCPAAVQALWSIQLPVSVRSHISNMEFTKESYKDVFESADKVYLSSKQVTIAAVATPVSADMNETVSAFDPQNQPQVAAVTRGRGGNRRGNRGNNSRRGSGRGGGQNRGGAQGGGASTRKRHASNPPESCCDRHYVHGADAWYCLAPLTCPWVSKVAQRP